MAEEDAIELERLWNGHRMDGGTIVQWLRDRANTCGESFAVAKAYVLTLADEIERCGLPDRGDDENGKPSVQTCHPRVEK